jgi:hypothetical protein
VFFRIGELEKLLTQAEATFKSYTNLAQLERDTVSDSSATPDKSNADLRQSVGFKTKPSLGYLIDRQWWRQALASAVNYAPNCLVCGLGLALLNIAIIVGNAAMEQHLRALTQGSINEVNLVQLLVVLVGALFALLALLGLSFWFLWIWYLRLTAFAHAWLVSDQAPTREQCQASISAIDKRKKFLTLVSLFASIYLLAPVIPLVVLIAIKLVSGPEFVVGDVRLVTLPDWMNSQAYYIASAAVSIFLSLVAGGYTACFTVFSAVSGMSPFQTATTALKECLRQPARVLAITALVLFANIAISAPYMLLSSSENVTSMIKGNVWLGVISQIWFGLTSLVLWPLAIAPFCQIVKTDTGGEVAD